ncbi:hypothetical protein COO91_03452 [Nostoc flagelliforme CCNUN1]|uniref:Uncharacterized protein n=1 Tax=Nostoc flagelliforme CCNUN1 TaxID=2038116 RepID=A0A2K8SPZ1_9NOSO|nr:hypothetical protein COO91_03452 [Nostoc flagelliforme CCNUN1]
MWRGKRSLKKQFYRLIKYKYSVRWRKLADNEKGKSSKKVLF